MPRRARHAGLLLLAILACTTSTAPASADSPVADQYLSAPPPVADPADRPGAPRPATANTERTAPGTSRAAAGQPTPGTPNGTGPGTGKDTDAGTRAGAPRRPPANAPAPLAVKRPANRGAVDLGSPAPAREALPIAALAGLGLLALALVLAAVARARRPAAMP